MELLYIWIEEYRNIKRQGFNFSSEYRFDFDYEVDKGTNEVIGGTLKIEDNPNYIPNFFGKGISNVTAIVGENGSGKSGILDFIKLLTKESQYFPDYAIDVQFIIAYYVNTNEKYKIKEGIYIDYNYVNITFPIFDKTKKVIMPNNNYLHPENCYIDNQFICLLRESETFNTIYYSSVFYDSLENHNEGFGSDENYNLRAIDISTKNIMSEYDTSFKFEYQQITQQINFLSFFAKQEKLRLKIPSYVIFLPKFYECIETKEYQEVIKLIADKAANYRSTKNEFDGFTIFSQDIMWNILIQTINNILKIKQNHESELGQKYLQKLKCFEEKPFVEGFNLFFEELKMKDNCLEDFLSLAKTYYHNYKELGKSPYLTFSLSSESAIIKESIILLNRITSLYRCGKLFDFQWYFHTDFLQPRGIMSYGEHTKLAFFARLFSLHSDDFDFNPILLIDEGELGFHPQWQKEYISKLIWFIPQVFKEKQTQIILTSHSPFVISDLPKDNVIFLKKDEDGNCQAADGLHEMKDTFGANIHTLLSDSFFMEGGLLGEFAQEKINKLIDYLNYRENELIEDDETAQKYINIIGEPILKRQLQKMLDSKRLQKVEDVEDKVNQLERTIQLLQQEVDKLKQKS